MREFISYLALLNAQFVVLECGNKSRKKKERRFSQYKDYYFYGCKHHKKQRGHECEFSKQINEEVIDSAVEEVIKTLVG